MERLIFKPEKGRTILTPEGDGEGYWIGAPSIFHDTELNKFFLYVRVRNPRPKKGRVNPEDVCRGYKCQILESSNGHDFNVIWEMKKKDLGVKSIEGASMIKIKEKYHLFLSYESHSLVPRWQIKKFIADHPSEFKPSSIHEIKWNLPLFHGLSIKDPIIKDFKGKKYLYIDYFRFWKKPWGATALFISTDGTSFKLKGDVFENTNKCKWASYMIRLTSIFEYDDEYFGFFDGTSKGSMLCEEKAGLARGATPDKVKIIDLDKPIFYSKHGSGSCRYLFGLKNEDETWVYYEHAEPNGEHALKMIKI